MKFFASALLFVAACSSVNGAVPPPVIAPTPAPAQVESTAPAKIAPAAVTPVAFVPPAATAPIVDVPTETIAPAALLAVAPPLHARVRHVLIISEDGLRGGAIEEMHLKWHERLIKHGSYSFKALTIRDASTLPAHASMLSGVDERAHGLSWNSWRPSRGYIKVQTIFDHAREARMSTAFFTGKPKLKHIVPPGSVDKYNRAGYLCKSVANDAAAYLVSAKPALAFVHFSDPDDKGHASGWMSPEQQHAIASSDRCLGILYEALEQAGLLDETLIIVSADHGGHNRVHSGASKIDREIPWIARGPGVREDFHDLEEISTMDTAATALYALGLPIPKELVGKPRTEIFIDQP